MLPPTPCRRGACPVLVPDGDAGRRPAGLELATRSTSSMPVPIAIGGGSRGPGPGHRRPARDPDTASDEEPTQTAESLKAYAREGKPVPQAGWAGPSRGGGRTQPSRDPHLRLPRHRRAGLPRNVAVQYNLRGLYETRPRPTIPRCRGPAPPPGRTGGAGRPDDLTEFQIQKLFAAMRSGSTRFAEDEVRRRTANAWATRCSNSPRRRSRTSRPSAGSV